MKTRVLLLIILFLGLLSCEKSLPKDDNPKMYTPEQTLINGNLWYAVNPFVSNDTILAVTNAYIKCAMYKDDGYSSYLKDLFSHHEGEIEEPECKHSYEAVVMFYPNKELCFYPILNGNFISLTNSSKDALLDSVNFNNVTLFTKYRDGDNDVKIHFYIGDFVGFSGSDYKTPPFISDSIVPSGEQIICFEAHWGPYYSGPFVNTQK